MKRMFFLTLLMFVAVGFLACSTTRSGVEKAYEIDVENDGDGMIVLFLDLDAATDTATKSGDADADNNVSPSTALGMQGSTATATGEDALMKGVQSLFDQYIDAKQTQHNATDAKSHEYPESKPEIPMPAEEVMEEIDGEALTIIAPVVDYLTLDQMATVSPRYPLGKKGSEFGCKGDMHFEWADGATMTVPHQDISVAYMKPNSDLKYQSGEWESAPNISKAEVYGHKQPASDNGHLERAPAYVTMTCEI